MNKPWVPILGIHTGRGHAAAHMWLWRTLQMKHNWQSQQSRSISLLDACCSLHMSIYLHFKKSYILHISVYFSNSLRPCFLQPHYITLPLDGLCICSCRHNFSSTEHDIFAVFHRIVEDDLKKNAVCFKTASFSNASAHRLVTGRILSHKSPSETVFMISPPLFCRAGGWLKSPWTEH